MRYIFVGLIVGILAFGWLVVRPYLQQVPCPYCKGKAFVVKIVEIPCPACRASGKVAPYQRDDILKQMEKERKQAEEEQKQQDAAMTETAPSY